MPSLAKCTMLTQQSTLLSPALIPVLLYISLRLWGCPLPSHTGRKGRAHRKNTCARHASHSISTCHLLLLKSLPAPPAARHLISFATVPAAHALSPLCACAYF
ncbi:hypothetical protein ABPG77_009178 [Micractinium sp. CCAP 211/92]